ncbi:MAG TPA: carboxypeptidase regulatory-like domain-containing protein [Chloroflexi bacterium]|jgi:hypothetical protein|nr:carboxypeptidase regulatory-like domain-containing protein [Chloroflexota bacterium]
MKNLWSLVLIAILLITGACQIDSGVPVIEKDAVTPVAPTPAEGQSTVIGRALNSSGEPLINISIRLAEVYRGEDGNAAFALDEAFSPAALTDNQGFFIFNSIPAGEYVLFIGSITTEFMIVQNSDGSAVVYKANPGEILEIETITATFD